MTFTRDNTAGFSDAELAQLNAAASRLQKAFPDIHAKSITDAVNNAFEEGVDDATLYARAARSLTGPPELNPMTADEFKQNLRKLGISQRDFAAETGMSWSAVNEWATGRAKLPPIAAAYIRLRFIDHHRRSG